MLMNKMSYLNLVGIEISKVESGYEVYTDDGGDTEVVLYKTKQEVADRLTNIKYYYLDEFYEKEEGNPKKEPSFKELNELINQYSSY